MREMWEHQVESIDALRDSIRQGLRRIVLQAPTGSGKTVMAAAIVEGAQRKGNRLAFIVSHLPLIDQVIEEFYSEGIRNVGVIQADHQMTDWSKPVQVCSIETLRSRKSYPDAQIVVIDECHVLHKFQKDWLHHPEWQGVPFIGLSATPWARGLGKYFDSLLVAATTQELIDKGLLSKFKVFATGHPNLKGVRIVAGDYHEGDLSEAMQSGSLTADIIDTWKKRHGKDKTLVYGVDCAHAQALQARFLEAGISAAYQDHNTSRKDRADIKKKFHSGEYRVVTNVGTLTTGVDWDVRCLVLARPTKSEMLFVQIIGRALRAAPGKDYALILDHSDTTERLGFVTDIHHDHLDDGRPKQKPKVRKPLPKPCPQCDCMLPRKLGICQNCGFKFSPSISGLIERDGELIDVTTGWPVQRKKKEPRSQATTEEKARFLSGLKYIGVERGYNEGWAANQYRSKFKVWPSYEIRDVVPRPPSVFVKQYVRSRQIAWANSKRRAEHVGG